MSRHAARLTKSTPQARSPARLGAVRPRLGGGAAPTKRGRSARRGAGRHSQHSRARLACRGRHAALGWAPSLCLRRTSGEHQPRGEGGAAPAAHRVVCGRGAVHPHTHSRGARSAEARTQTPARARKVLRGHVGALRREARGARAVGWGGCSPARARPLPAGAGGGVLRRRGARRVQRNVQTDLRPRWFVSSWRARAGVGLPRARALGHSTLARRVVGLSGEVWCAAAVRAMRLEAAAARLADASRAVGLCAPPAGAAALDAAAAWGDAAASAVAAAGGADAERAAAERVAAAAGRPTGGGLRRGRAAGRAARAARGAARLRGGGRRACRAAARGGRVRAPRAGAEASQAAAHGAGGGRRAGASGRGRRASACHPCAWRGCVWQCDARKQRGA